jgi:hypothetical protein
MTNPYRAMCAELLEALEIQLDELRFNNRLCIRARALLAQPVAEGPTDEELDELYFYVKWGRPTPQPVAVSERLPGPDDCLDEGWAWFFNQRIGWRQAVLPVSTGYTHWLPANALPTPEATNE